MNHRNALIETTNLQFTASSVFCTNLIDTSKVMRFHRCTIQNSKKSSTLVNKPLEYSKLAQKDRNVKIK
jgi:hypothetical protein